MKDRCRFSESDDDETITMQLEMPSAQNLRDSKTKPIPFHTYHSIDLGIVFVYGTDLERQQNSIFTSVFGKRSLQICMVYHFLAAAVLCYLRRKERLPRDGYTTCYIDIFVAVFGGATIRITHRYERWIFRIVYIANFFMVAIYGGLVMYPSIFERDQSIKSFEEITSINPPIFMHPDLTKHDEDVIDMLRFDSTILKFLLNLLFKYFKLFVRF